MLDRPRLPENVEVYARFFVGFGVEWCFRMGTESADRSERCEGEEGLVSNREKNDRAITLCKQLSKQSGLSIREVATLARTIAIAEIDPLHTIHGEPIVVDFRTKQRKTFPFSCPSENLYHLSDPPDPFDPTADLLEALDRYRFDSDRGYYLLCNDDHTIEGARRVIENQRRWARFFAVRHPSKVFRRWYAEYEQAIENGNVEEWARGIVADCESLGIKVTNERSLMKIEE